MMHMELEKNKDKQVCCEKGCDYVALIEKDNSNGNRCRNLSHESVCFLYLFMLK